MLNQEIRILDFDSSVTKQPRLLSKYPHKIIALKDLAPRVRLWMDSRARADLLKRVGDPNPGSVAFLGSGDFHNLTSLLLSRFNQPISLIVFDFHPDWDIFPPRFGCGSWVTEALKKENILKCLLIAASSEDISAPSIQSANLSALFKDRLEIYPYQHAPTKVFLRKVPQNVSLRTRRGFLYNEIHWDELKNKDLQDFFSSVIRRLPAKDVYVSIDKDCLKSKYSLTNWEEGALELDELLLMLRLIKENLNIVGLDITGDYSKVAISGRLKNFFSKMDHPKAVPADKFSQEEIDHINESTNLKILETLLS